MNGSEPTVSTSLEHLLAGSQGIVSKRIDLALLEGEDLLTRAIGRAAMIGVGMMLAAGAWFAAALALAMALVPETMPALRMTAFAVANIAAASVVVTLAQRRPPAFARRDAGHGIADAVGKASGAPGREMTVESPDYTEQRDDLLQSIEKDEQKIRVAVLELTKAAGFRLDPSERIRQWPLAWAAGAFLVGAWLGTPSLSDQDIQRRRSR